MLIQSNLGFNVQYGRNRQSSCIVFLHGFIRNVDSDDLITNDDYKVHGMFQVGKGGGTAIIVISNLMSLIPLSVTKVKQIKILVVLRGSHLAVDGCYRPLSASEDAFKSMSNIPH